MGRRVEILGEKCAVLPLDETRFFTLPCVYMMVHEENARFVDQRPRERHAPARIGRAVTRPRASGAGR